jgi:hypothetical protein
MPPRNIHLKFDRLLADQNIIKGSTDPNIVHKKLDDIKGKHHRVFSKSHSIDAIRQFLKDGKPLENGKGILEKALLWIKYKRGLDQRTKTDYIRIACGHEIVDDLWTKHKKRFGKDPVDLDGFLTKCLMHFKYHDYNLVRFVNSRRK